MPLKVPSKTMTDLAWAIVVAIITFAWFQEAAETAAEEEPLEA